MRAWVSLVWLFGCMLGTRIASPVTQRVGPRRTLLSINILIATSSVMGCIGVLVGGKTCFAILLVNRLFVGVHNGVALAVCPLYLRGISPPPLRPHMEQIHHSCLALGIFLGQIVGLKQLFGSNGGFALANQQWQRENSENAPEKEIAPEEYTLACCLAFLVGEFFPLATYFFLRSSEESPLYLFKTHFGAEEIPRETLMKLRNRDESVVDAELEEIRREFALEIFINPVSIGDLFSPLYRMATYLVWLYRYFDHQYAITYICL